MPLPGDVGNIAGNQDKDLWEGFLLREGMTPADYQILDQAGKNTIFDRYSTFLNTSKTERDLSKDPNAYLQDVMGVMREMNQDDINAESKRFEDALKYSREGAKTKMMMKLPGQIADIARMPGAIQLQAAQEQAKRTQDFIRSIALMDNVKTIDPGSVPNRKYFG